MSRVITMALSTIQALGKSNLVIRFRFSGLFYSLFLISSFHALFLTYFLFFLILCFFCSSLWFSYSLSRSIFKNNVYHFSASTVPFFQTRSSPDSDLSYFSAHSQSSEGVPLKKRVLIKIRESNHFSHTLFSVKWIREQIYALYTYRPTVYIQELHMLHFRRPFSRYRDVLHVL